jgi:hypothetical protein
MDYGLHATLFATYNSLPFSNQLLNRFTDKTDRLLNTVLFLNNKFSYSHFRRVPPDATFRPDTLGLLAWCSPNLASHGQIQVTQPGNTLLKGTCVSKPRTKQLTVTPCPNAHKILRSSSLSARTSCLILHFYATSVLLNLISKHNKSPPTLNYKTSVQRQELAQRTLATWKQTMVKMGPSHSRDKILYSSDDLPLHL